MHTCQNSFLEVLLKWIFFFFCINVFSFQIWCKTISRNLCLEIKKSFLPETAPKKLTTFCCPSLTQNHNFRVCFIWSKIYFVKEKAISGDFLLLFYLCAFYCWLFFGWFWVLFLRLCIWLKFHLIFIRAECKFSRTCYFTGYHMLFTNTLRNSTHLRENPAVFTQILRV